MRALNIINAAVSMIANIFRRPRPPAIKAPWAPEHAGVTRYRAPSKDYPAAMRNRISRHRAHNRAARSARRAQRRQAQGYP